VSFRRRPRRAIPAIVGGKRALVTGAGRGIGRATALALARAGHEVICVARTAADLDAVVDEIEAGGGRARSVTVDVTDSAALAELEVEGVSALVNCAGGNFPEAFVDVSEEHLDRLLAVNVKATFLVSQRVVRAMRVAGRGGSIVNLSSQMGHVGSPRRTVYCATKHAVEGLTRAMAVELAPHGIRVNAVAPTFVETPMTAEYLADREFRDWVVERIPLGRLAGVADVAAAVCFLTSDSARMITGASLAVDGGWTAQ
jgi:NAD(P)-dependent dehydrogenase (short-subunit alcohol dehydrogenase family)